MATVGRVCLALAYVGHILGQMYPDNRGTEFVVGYMANYKLENSPELFVTTSRSTIVSVTVTAPMFPAANLNEVFTVTEGEVHQVFINNSIRALGTSKETKGIVVTASDEVVVYGTNVESYSNDAFLGFPVDVLGNDYYTVSHYPSTMECEFMLVGVYDSTNVSITFGTHPEIDVVYEGVHYYNGSVLEINMNRLDTFQVQTFGDLTGSHIASDRDVVVFSGNMFTSVEGTSRDHLVDQMLPVHTWGKLFVTVPIPYRLVVKPGDEVKFIASENDTFVEVDCSGGYNVSFSLEAGNYAQYILPSDECCSVNATQPIMVILIVLSQFDKKEPADPALITIPPVEQYAHEYTLATPKYSNGVYRNFAMFIVEESLKDGLLIDGESLPKRTEYTPVPGTSFVGGFFEVSDGTHNFHHSASSVFGLFMYGTAKWETYGMPGGLSLAHINGWCDLSFTPVDGDGIDNDCDDLIDEEDCSPENNGTDDDGDGLVDEDCALPPPIDGNWTEWSAWSACSVSCLALGDNSTTGIKTRNRNCSVPMPEYGGYMCVGHSNETSSCPDTMCPVHGEWSNWQGWSSCSATCGNGTFTRSRTCTDPAPDHGGDNCTGAHSETEICNTGVGCPVNGGFSDWSSWDSCTVSCDGGTQNRSRSCTNPEPLHGGALCMGYTDEQQDCNTHICPVNGAWAEWSEWNSCSIRCGTGMTSRNRSCSDPVPQFNGTDCVGDSTEISTCNGACGVDGSWGFWNSWSECTQTCGTGHRARVRICDNPVPTPDGNPCFGDAVLLEECNNQTCVGPVAWITNGTYVNVCPERFFSCKDGGISCVEQIFRCDCVSDCDDGSDESPEWAMCSDRLFTYCERNIAYGEFSWTKTYFILILTLVIWVFIS